MCISIRVTECLHVIWKGGPLNFFFLRSLVGLKSQKVANDPWSYQTKSARTSEIHRFVLNQVEHHGQSGLLYRAESWTLGRGHRCSLLVGEHADLCLIKHHLHTRTGHGFLSELTALWSSNIQLISYCTISKCLCTSVQMTGENMDSITSLKKKKKNSKKLWPLPCVSMTNFTFLIWFHVFSILILHIFPQNVFLNVILLYQVSWSDWQLFATHWTLSCAPSVLQSRNIQVLSQINRRSDDPHQPRDKNTK